MHVYRAVQHYLSSIPSIVAFDEVVLIFTWLCHHDGLSTAHVHLDWL